MKTRGFIVTFFVALRNEIFAFLDAMFTFMPGRTGNVLRRFWFGRRFQVKGNLSCATGCEFRSPQTINFGGAVSIGKNSFFTAEGGSIQIGDHSVFNMNVHINASIGGSITIGKFCAIGPNVLMRTSDHKFDNPNANIRGQGHNPASICIGDGVWIGANAVILGGTHIGNGAVVGAGAVVTKDVPPMAVVVGVPAKILRYRRQEPAKP